jgi:hypothetical protein
MKSFAHRTTNRKLANAGLMRDEIRMLGAYHGLRAAQQQAVLTLLSVLVIENAREDDEACAVSTTGGPR